MSDISMEDYVIRSLNFNKKLSAFLDKVKEHPHLIWPLLIDNAMTTASLLGVSKELFMEKITSNLEIFNDLNIFSKNNIHDKNKCH